MLTEPAARARDWALFAAAALLPALALGALGLRALGSEEAAIEREAKIALEASAERAVRELGPAIETAAAALARDPAQLSALTPPFADAVILGADRALLFPTLGRARQADPPRADGRCDALAGKLPTARDPKARTALRDELLATCAESRAPSGRWLYPLVVVEGFSPGDAGPLAGWLETHAAKLSSLERAAIREDLGTLALDAATRERALRAVVATDQGAAALPLVLREAELAEGLRRPLAVDGALSFRTPSALVALHAGEGGKVAGFVVHRASLAAGLARGWPALGPDLRATLEPSTPARPGELRATRAITSDLALTVRLADPLLLARRTARSRTVLASAALLATVGAFAVAALLFARMRAARRASALRTDFVAAVSHELRTPIASVRMLAELLEQGRVEDDERAEVHTALAAEARRLGATVDRLLGFARMASGRRVLAKSRENVAAAVEESIRVFEERAPSEQPVMRELDRTLFASIDAAELRLAVDNLLANARKYAPEGTPYAVRVSAERGGVAISVSDRGPGIARGDQRRIFEPFERADDRLSRATEGSGIGLSLVRHVARAHGGDVRVESEPGHGARFTIWVPRGEP